VGVVQDVRTEGLDRPAVPMVYMPYFPGWGLRFLVRSNNGPSAFLPVLRDRVRSTTPGALVQRYRGLPEILDETVRPRMLSGVLAGGFALLGLIISSVGLYGTLAARVQQRRREIGLRIALGADVHHVVGTILGDGLKIVALGTVAGIGGSLAAAWAIQRELYLVGPLDAASFAAAIGLLSAAALSACLIPALRARRVDPIQALKVQ
jgi:putative ABC transport system permease protein